MSHELSVIHVTSSQKAIHSKMAHKAHSKEHWERILRSYAKGRYNVKREQPHKQSEARHILNRIITCSTHSWASAGREKHRQEVADVHTSHQSEIKGIQNELSFSATIT